MVYREIITGNMAENIYPIFDKMLQRSDREALLKQRGIMIWFTGLSGSGKSTLAIALEECRLCIIILN